MNRKWIAFALSGVLLCSMSASALAAGPLSPAARDGETGAEQTAPVLPDSQRYDGEVKEIRTGEDGAVTGLYMTSEQAGDYVMLVSQETVWIDGGTRTPGSPSGLAAGERLCVFHSPVSTRSLPPQSAAFAVVRHAPGQAGGAAYHKVEAVEAREDGLQITTNNGGLLLYVGEETALSAYNGDPVEGPEAIRVGSHIMAWYGAVALSYPGQAHAQHIMLLEPEAQPLSRRALIALLYEAQGSPAADGEVRYRDVDPSGPDAPAIRWAASRGIVSGYGDGRLGPDDAVNREQMAVMLWRWAGSPRLMDYPGLTRYSDVSDISSFAQSALAWAHQKQLLPAAGRLGPKDAVTLEEAQAMLAALQGDERG